jgi:hypothetical protein
MLQKFFTVNVPVNISMLNELADRIAIALGYSFPTYMESRSVGKSAFSLGDAENFFIVQKPVESEL